MRCCGHRRKKLVPGWLSAAYDEHPGTNIGNHKTGHHKENGLLTGSHIIPDATRHWVHVTNEKQTLSA